MYRLCLGLVLLTFSQVILAQEIDDLVAAYQPLIEERQNNLGLSIGIQRKTIGITYGALDKQIRDAVTNVNTERAALEAQQEAVVTKAQEANQIIDNCLDEEQSSLSLVNLGDLQKCRNANELVLALRKIVELGIEQRKLGSLVARCNVTDQLDSAGLKSCLDDGLQNIDDKISSTTSEMDSLTSNALANGTACISAAEENLKDTLQNISKALNDCVNGALTA